MISNTMSFSNVRHSAGLCGRPHPHRLYVNASAAPAIGSQQAAASFKPAKPFVATMFDTPLSNSGARIRFLLYKMGLEDTIDVQAPSTIGGLKSPEYLALNPYGKMPLLVLEDGTALPESQVIESYILDKYKGTKLVPDTPELRAHAALVARVHDIYVVPIQGCMYKTMASPADRYAQLQQISFQLDVLENLVIGPFMCGNELSYADSALMPTFVFFLWILPRYFKWKSVFTGRPKLEKWWKVISSDPEAARVISEIEGGMQAWEDGGRWEVQGVNAHVADESFDWSCGC